MQSTKVTKRPLSAIQIDDDTTRIVITATPSELSSDSEKEVCYILLLINHFIECMLYLFTSMENIW